MYQPLFTITPEINNRIVQLERIRTIIASSKILPKEEIILRHRALVDAVHSSTSIEGNPLNKEQVENVISGQIIRASQQAIIEVQNYKKALDWMEKRTQTLQKITLRDVFRLHHITLNGLLHPAKVGIFRSGPVYIVDVIGQEEQVRYTGPSPSALSKLCQDLFIWLYSAKNTLHPLLKAGIFHYEFVSIHPFGDGNGRVTRLLTLLYLRQNSYGFRNALIPDTYYLQNRQGYYHALRQADSYRQQRVADITPWLEYFTKGLVDVASQLEHDISVVKVQSSNQTPIRLSRQELKILDFARQVGQISLKDVLDILEVPKRTAQRWLADLVKWRLLKREGVGRNTVYKLQ